MTNQEAVDTIAQHLIAQNKRCVDVDDLERCLYRGPDGMKCAVGVLIPDSEYREEFDWFEFKGMSLQEIMDECPSISSLNYKMLAELQYVHDSQGAWGSSGLTRDGAMKFIEAIEHVNKYCREEGEEHLRIPQCILDLHENG